MSLSKIEHIVVVMMENRSFDHLVGYLGDTMPAVRGRNKNATNPDKNGAPVRANLLTGFTFPFDPGHDSAQVATQLGNGNQGFVSDFQAKFPDAPPAAIMGYHDADAVPVYDFLARNFAVCDGWHASLPGPTIPNRFYAVAGTSGGYKDNPKTTGLLKRFDFKTIFSCLDAGLKSRPKADRWGYYYQDLTFLWLMKKHTRDSLPGGRVRKWSDFFKRAKAGNLPAVSWIDPNFGDVGAQNDDHPPGGDLRDGQRMVGRIYDALHNGGNNLWQKTLLIVTYDEHGGFYDHVVPGAVADDRPDFRRLGVRVPAFVASPWVTPQVDHTTREHASILRTILDRFAPNETLTTRVAKAASLAPLLNAALPRADVPVLVVPPGAPGSDFEVAARSATGAAPMAMRARATAAAAPRARARSAPRSRPHHDVQLLLKAYNPHKGPMKVARKAAGKKATAARKRTTRKPTRKPVRKATRSRPR